MFFLGLVVVWSEINILVVHWGGLQGFDVMIVVLVMVVCDKVFANRDKKSKVQDLSFGTFTDVPMVADD